MGHFFQVLIQYVSYGPITDFFRQQLDFQGLLFKRLGLGMLQAVYFKLCDIRFLPVSNQVENTGWGEKCHLCVDDFQTQLI